MSSPPEPISILFVCLGNICRSTMAEGVFRSLVAKAPYESLISVVDSCGTGGWHTGNSPDHRTMKMLEDNGITDYRHGARKIHDSDFSKFHYIFAMDQENLKDLKKIQRRVGGSAKVMLFGKYSGKGETEEVEDPYYGVKDGFQTAYEQCMRFSKNFLKETFPDVSQP